MEHATTAAPNCAKTFVLWDTIDRTTGRMGRATECPVCLHRADRRRFEAVANEPAWIAFERSDGSRGEKQATAADRRRAHVVRVDPNLWTPSSNLGPDREMYLRCALHLQDINDVRDLYTARNLRALALIWREIQAEPNDRVQRALAFAFTNTSLAWHADAAVQRPWRPPASHGHPLRPATVLRGQCLGGDAQEDRPAHPLLRRFRPDEGTWRPISS